MTQIVLSIALYIVQGQRVFSEVHSRVFQTERSVWEFFKERRFSSLNS